MRLYVITRRDLSKSYRAVQGMHAVAEFCILHKDEAKFWNKHSNYIINLTVENEEELSRLCHESDHLMATFTEPDIGYELSAAAILAPKRAFKNLPLA